MAAEKKNKKAAKSTATKRKMAAPRAAVLVVNMIPKSLSGEHHQDSEPTIAVNPANPLQIAGTAFTPDPAHGNRAPIYISIDGGNTWTLNSIVPSSAADGSATADITVAFASASNNLYAGIIRLPFPADRPRLNILRAGNFQSGSPMMVLVDRTGRGVDQPYVQAITMSGGPNAGKDRVYVGDNDFNALGGRTATVDESANAGGANPAFRSVRIEKRSTPGQDGPSVRPAAHADGTVYAAFYSWRSFNNSTGAGTADIVVVRDDQGGTGLNPFTALIDPADGRAGMRVARGVRFTFGSFLGLQRIGGDVSIAIDPSNSSAVFLAWADYQGSTYTLHVRRSINRGVTWSGADQRTVFNATNPALAINSEGKVGFLYQQLSGLGTSQRWVNKLELSADGANWNSLVLATVPANAPPKQFDPYIGDYDHLLAVGKDFYGVFSANNTPNNANFPNGVVYRRNAHFATHTLLDIDNRTPVNVSIDPFFFRVLG